MTDDNSLFYSCNFRYYFNLNNDQFNYLFLFESKHRKLSRNSIQENVLCLQNEGKERIQFWERNFVERDGGI